MKSTHNTMIAYGKSTLATLGIVTGTALLMVACNVTPKVRTWDQTTVSPKVQVPAGNVVALETTAVGNLTYVCRNDIPTAGSMGWALVTPSAKLYSREGQEIGTYSGPPATWRLNDGSSVVGTQVAIEPVVGGIHIPLQLSKAQSGPTPGMLSNITYVQRVNTKNGADFVTNCTQSELGKTVVRPYSADYIFWKAA
ncbi:MAG: DUF3455 domain-containing protein [Pseudomonadota bacterium]